MARERAYTTISVSQETGDWLRELKADLDHSNLEETVSHLIDVYEYDD